MGQQYIGERFGDYKAVRLLGEGGFASVYLGQEVHDGTFAAVKLLKEQKVHDFINEVSRTNRLQHPNIVKILDFESITHSPQFEPVPTGKRTNVHSQMPSNAIEQFFHERNHTI